MTPIKYSTGWPRLDSILNVVAAGVTLVAMFCILAIAAIIIWRGIP